MEEIVKGGNVNLEDFPSDFDSMSPKRQVSLNIYIYFEFKHIASGWPICL